MLGGLRALLLYYGGERPVAELSGEFADLVMKSLESDALEVRNAAQHS
jgi:hypothetical protein